MRRSSLPDDFVRQHFSNSSERLTASLQSLTLDPENLDSVSKNVCHYGSIENGDCDEGCDNDVAQLEDGPIPRQNESLSSTISEHAGLLKDELIAMITLGVPVIATYFLEIVPGMITIVLVGRMDNGEDTKLYVDAAALAVMYFNIVGFSTGLGLLTALDTLYASAYGANQPSKMGQYLLTGIALMTATFCIVGVALCNTTTVLLLFGQPPSVADPAGIFALWMLPGLAFLYAYELLRKLSQAKNETLPMIISAVMSVFANIASGFYLVNYTTWGWLGAALARTLAYMALFPTVLICMLLSDKDEFLSRVWGGCRVKEAMTMKAILTFLDLGIPGMLQLQFEWCAFEVIALLCGIFPDEDEAIIAIGSNAIVYQISTLIYMLYVGASMAGNVRIGNALGAGDAHRARVASYLTLALGICLSLMNISLLLGFREVLPYFFTTDKDLIIKAQHLFLVVALYQFPDAVNCVEQGIFRAIGKQFLCAKLNFIAYYIIGIPIGYVLGLPLAWGVEGLWLGMTVGLVFVSTVNTIVLLRCDWKQLSLEARKRLLVDVPVENKVLAQ